jgi:predicted enzyme related to lactoylglutathione lyase
MMITMKGDSMNITNISILSVPVKDQEAAKAFYSEKLGFTVLRDDAFGDQRWIQLAPDGAQTAITLVKGEFPMAPGSQQGIVLATKDVRADYEALRTRGVAISEIENAPWGPYATFNDPDGNGWVLQESTD